LQVCLDPQDELLLTFFLSGNVTGHVGAAAHEAPKALDFRPGRALLRTPNRSGGYLIHVPGACRNMFVQFRLKRAQLPQWLRALDVHLDSHQMQQLMHLDNGSVLCNAALTSRIQACLARIHAEDAAAPSFAPLFQARSIELLTYVMLDLVELLRPDRSAGATGRPASQVVSKVQACIDDQPSRSWTVAELARQGGCSESRLQRDFRNATGVSVHQYLRAARLDLAARLLRETHLSVQQVAQEAGWQCHGRFGAAFREHHGVTPLAFRLAGA
nr:helix-turn-helix transcriptional regulator [Burkholderiaceae bacterium]